MTSYHLMLKFIIVGDTAVGKSSLLLQFTDQKFKNNHEATIGIEFGSQTISIRDKIVKLQIWDSAGQENYRSITRSYYRNSIGALLVYDITSRNSFDSIKSWLEETRLHGNENVVILLIGNKCDIADQRVISKEEGEAFAAQRNICFMECSAKKCVNVERAFKTISEKVLEKIDTGEINAYEENCGVRVGSKLHNQVVLEKHGIQSKEGKGSGCC